MGGTALLLLCNSCTDKDYDLNDIDTTASFKVKELTVPINLDTLTLDQVMDLKDGSEITKEKDAAGNEFYAVKKDGNFQSSAVSVKQITATPTITSTTSTVSMTGSPVSILGGWTADYDISNVNVSFSASATGVDDAILRIDSLGVNSTLSLNLSITGITSYKLKNLKIELPAGIKCSKPAKGDFIETNPSMPDYSLLDLTGETLNAGESINLNIIKYYTVTKTGNVKNIIFDENARTISINDRINVQSGTIELSNSTSSFPGSVTFKVAPTMNNLVVTSFTGQVEYKVEDFNIDPIDLTNLPDFLNQEGTKLGLENPQIYLGINNPLGNVKNTASSTTYLQLQTAFRMTPERDGVKGATQKLDPDPSILGETEGKLRIKGGTTAEQCFIVSPTDPKPNYDPEYTTNPSFVKFTGLKQVLKETDGIPTKITVEAYQPKLPTQDVYNLELGKDYGTVNGRYRFFAPLQLSNDTRISYTDTIDGWNDEDVDAMTLNRIEMNMLISTEVPFPITLQIVPITVDGKAIPGASSNIVDIPAMAKDYPTKLTINATVKHLDGLLLKAKAQNPDDTVVLGPQMKLIINNSKVTLTGNYTKEL